MQKQNVPINFSGDIDTKTDPFQVAPNNFISFQNASRRTAGRLEKRYGFAQLAAFSVPYATSLATFNGGLVGVGSSIQVLSGSTGALINRGTFQPVDLSVIPAIRMSENLVSADVAIAPNGLACVVSTATTSGPVYQIIESASGNVVVPITAIGSTALGPRVYLLGDSFVVTYCISIAGTVHLRYIRIPYATPNSPSAPVDISTQTTARCAYEGNVSANILYLAWNSNDNSGNSIRLASLSSSFVLSASTQQNAPNPYTISIAVDSSGGSPVIWVSWASYDTGSFILTAYTAAFNSSLVNILGNQTLYTNGGSPGGMITSVATGAVLTAYFDQDGGAPGGGTTDIVLVARCTQAGSVTPAANLILSVGLASKAFINPTNGVTYFLGLYRGALQPTYFLIDGSANILAKLAYSNGAIGPGILSSVNQVGSTLQIAYLFKDLVLAANKNTLVGGNVVTGGLYSQAGVNVATFMLGASDTVTSEIGGALQLSGGYLWMFDGQKPVEQGFHVYPEDISASWSATGGAIVAKPDGSTNTNAYAYQITYEWTDASGNIHRSAPSVPIFVTTTGTGTAGSVTLTISTLRLTAKIAPNPVRIVVYRWSVANQAYYQITSLTSTSGTNPMIINDPSVISVSFVDKLADASIVGNNLIYTTGGVIENIAAPATKIMTLFDTRLWVVDSEDPNLLWYSKQVIESVPVEMSDLLTLYVAPTTGSTGSTGPTTALSTMDDKLIVFKANAIYYINGAGPDNTGSNNQYSQPIFITATVGCSNPKSIVLMQDGIMFQSDQGIWLLGRDLSTKYVGAPVQGYNDLSVTSSINIPETTEVRFSLSNGTELIYDYYYRKWDTAITIDSLSSVLYQGLHTYLNSAGVIYQETPGIYADGASAIPMSFESPWYNLAGLQGYERAYYFYLMGQYLSAHSLTVAIYFDYESSASQTVTINPSSSQPLEQWRVFLKRQKFQAFKFTLTEVISTPGAGLTLSGINLVVGIKKGYKPIAGANSAG